MSALFVLAMGCVPLHAATGTHLPKSTLYPRLIRLHHARGPLQNSILAKTSNRLFRSLDDGRTFIYLTAVPTNNTEGADPAPASGPAPAAAADANKERCCSTIFELPRAIGRFKAGTLLYSGSFFSGGIPAIELFTSSDAGEHWSYLSTPIKAGDLHHGLWEPEFTVAKDGSLVMFVSDETDPCCSQKLVQMRTRDLRTWSPKQDTVAGTRHPDRPGMAVVSTLPDGTYLMSYEVCGPAAHCQVFIRTSTDGWNFGNPADFGTRAVTTSGQYFAHAPSQTVDAATQQILLVGQVLYANDGTVSQENGRLLFTHALADLSGPWHTRRAPVEVPAAYDNFCPNYSSALMPTESGLLELASDYDEAHHCTSYFATLPRPSSPADARKPPPGD